MSTPEALGTLTAGSIGSSSAPVVNQALEPAGVRDGSPAAKQAYDEALSFESVLVNQLCQQLASSSGLTGGGDSSGLDGDASDGSASDPTVSAFGSLLPGALASSIMSSGGLGLAAQLYPSLEVGGEQSTTADEASAA
jgi:Rod binding domain-containing protein